MSFAPSSSSLAFFMLSSNCSKMICRANLVPAFCITSTGRHKVTSSLAMAISDPLDAWKKSISKGITSWKVADFPHPVAPATVPVPPGALDEHAPGPRHHRVEFLPARRATEPQHAVAIFNHCPHLLAPFRLLRRSGTDSPFGLCAGFFGLAGRSIARVEPQDPPVLI